MFVLRLLPVVELGFFNSNSIKLSSPSQKWRAFPETSARLARVPSGVPVQRSISERDVSHPTQQLADF